MVQHPVSTFKWKVSYLDVRVLAHEVVDEFLVIETPAGYTEDDTNLE